MVIIVIFFLAWYIPRVIARHGSFAQKSKNIAILEKIPVSKDSYIVLLKTFEKVMVIGVTPGSMTNLRDLEEGEYSAEETQQENISFAAAIKTALQDVIPEGRIKEAIEKRLHKGNGGDGVER